jgi:hypothetical protein
VIGRGEKTVLEHAAIGAFQITITQIIELGTAAIAHPIMRLRLMFYGETKYV